MNGHVLNTVFQIIKLVILRVITNSLRFVQSYGPHEFQPSTI